MVRKFYTKEQLLKKYAGKFIEVYPSHYEQKNEKGEWITVYEVKSVKKRICKNHNLPEDIVTNLAYALKKWIKAEYIQKFELNRKKEREIK